MDLIQLHCNVVTLLESRLKPNLRCSENAIFHPCSPTAIPSHVTPPPYFVTGDPGPSPLEPEVKSAETIGKMRESCRLAGRILRQCGEMLAPGVTTDRIDQFVTQAAFDAGAYPSPLNYR